MKLIKGMDIFELALRKKFLKCLPNNFRDNHDRLRFGEESKTFLTTVKTFIFRNYTSNYFIKKSIKKLDEFFQRYGDDASKCYQLFSNEQSRNLYLDLLCYRILGKNKVKIQDTRDFLEKRNKLQFVRGNSEKIEIDFFSKSWTLENFSIDINNTKLNIISRPSALFAEFAVEQYTYANKDARIGVERGDYCIDAGACWGDSTLYFAANVGNLGKVFAFEFIPGNIKILDRNLRLNATVANNVIVVKRPLWSMTGSPVWYLDRGPASQISFDPIAGTDRVDTYTIDELVNDYNLEKLNFIKMDIEGAEGFALAGAKQAIIRFKPKLAICIYHNIGDFTKIAQWINDLGLGYKFYLKHATIHQEETVLFAAQ